MDDISRESAIYALHKDWNLDMEWLRGLSNGQLSDEWRYRYGEDIFVMDEE